VKVKTSRFGDLNVEKSDIVHFADGILGFDHLKHFFIVDPGDSTLILWLQSIDDVNVAFPIIEPKIFKQDYVVKLLPSELNGLELESVNDAKVYSILTIPRDVTTMTANLKAPVVINGRTNESRQIVLQDSKLSVRYEMYKALKQYIVNYFSDDSKPTPPESGPEAVSPKRDRIAQTTH